MVWSVTATPLQESTETGAPENGAPVVSGEFVIVDAPMPDHTASEDGDNSPLSEELGKRGPSRARALLGAAKSRTKNGADERPVKEAKRAPVAPRGGFVKPLTEMYGSIALMLLPFDAECAMAIMEAAPKAAESLDNLAKSNPAVKKVLIALTQTSAWGAVLAAHAPIILAVTIHHVPAVKNSPVAALLRSNQTASNGE